MATIKNVAKRAGVSVATVSAVINKNSGVNVSKELTRRVEDTIREMNYRPNRIAQALSLNRTRTIAYVVPTISNTFFSQLAHFIENNAFDINYGVYLCNTHGKIDRVNLYRDILIENRVAGVLTSLTWDIIETGFIESIQKENIPIVGLAGARILEKLDTVSIDDVMGGKISVNHLIKRGHKKIAFIGARESKTTEERLKGYSIALGEAGIEIDEKLIILGNNFDRIEGYNLARKLYLRYSEFTAVFVYNDEMAAGVIDRFNDYGIIIPDEIAVVGYDNSVANYTRPKLTTLDLFKKKMVDIAMDILISRIKKKEFPYRQEKIAPRLIIKESS